VTYSSDKVRNIVLVFVLNLNMMKQATCSNADQELKLIAKFKIQCMVEINNPTLN
jgi:hypothetical protein